MRIYRYSFLLLAVSVLAAGTRDQTKAEEQTKNSSPPCVEVQIGQDTTSRLDCLNSQLQHSVERQANAPLPQVPITAQSDSNTVGTFNDAAAREKMGNAYGITSQPQRPKPVFVSPLVPSATP